MTDHDRTRSSDDPSRLTRRSFLRGSAAIGVAVPLSGGVFVSGNGDVAPDPWIHGSGDEILAQPTDTPRHWLGPELWGNRLQDWQNTGGRIECLRSEAGDELRTVAVLTREMVSGAEPGHLRTVTGIAGGVGSDGFAGVLLGIGGGELDYRAAALAQRSSGAGGGFMCTYETDGRVRFREHVDQENPFSYAVIPADASSTRSADDSRTTTSPGDSTPTTTPADGSTPTTTPAGDGATTSTVDDPARDEGVRLVIDVLPQGDGRFTLVVTTFAVGTGEGVARAVRRDVPEPSLLGGIALVSSPPPGEDGSRWWFEGIETAGAKLATHPDRTFGPIVGSLYSIDGSVLKLSAQLFPMAASDPQTVQLHYRPTGGSDEWEAARATIGEGHVASFRIAGWDHRRAWDYRVVYRDRTGAIWDYEGHVPADPGEEEALTIGLLSCTSACGRRLDTDAPRGDAPGRYTPGNIYVPYETLTRHLRAHDPDLLVSVGDQFYESRPAAPDDREDPVLDLLYRWFLWHWSFREITRDTPTILLVDDHDVYQGNLWGSAGDDIPVGAPREGGYVAAADAVDRMQRIQCVHDPDPYDPSPIERGIDVYYGEFTYGGTRFAMLEDRKFKTGPAESAGDDEERALLGDRQEQFLEEWAASGDDDVPSVCLTQTIFASALTTPEGDALAGLDTNGFPPAGRDRAIRLLREAGALVLAGDQHLPTLVRHGVDDRTDGVVQFTGPAGGAFFLRWFEPSDPLSNDRGHRFTGEFVDAFGNPFRMLAVANPDVSHERFAGMDRDPVVFDRDRRSDGYGIVRVDHAKEEFVVECWPRSVDPTGESAAQFPGWPYRLPFDETDGRER